MKRMSLLVVLTLVSLTANSQPDAAVFSSTEFVWCGIDYSNVRCIGPQGFNEPDQIKYKFFQSWNDLVLEEANKYDFKGAYQKSSQITDLSVVRRRNEMPKVSELVITEDYKFEKGQLKEIIADYNLEKADEGLGLVYVVESMNKNRQHAIVHIVFFDIASKEILWAMKYTGRATGFGFRNYWARPIYETIKASKKTYSRELKEYRRRN